MLEGALHAGFKLLVRLPRQDKQMILDPVLHPAIAGRRNAPVEDKIEIAEGLLGEQILAVTRFRGCLQAAVVDSPSVSRRRLLTRVHPTLHRFSIEQKDPASGLLFRSE